MEEGEKIRVLHVLPWVASGGVERRRRELARHLPSGVFEQRVFCLDTVGPLVEEFAEHGVPVEAVGDAEVNDLRVYRRLWRLVRSYRPHIIHGAVFEGVRMAVLGARMRRTPVLVVEETSHATNRGAAGHLLFRACAVVADACVAISPAVADYAHEHSRIPRSKLITISNGVPIPAPQDAAVVAAVRDELHASDDDVLAVTVGRLYDDTHKRVSDVIRAMADAPDELKLAVIGEGPIRSDLEALSRELGVNDRVFFAGYRHDMDAVYQAADIFVLASGREGFGLVVAEAMMHGLPTVTTPAGGISDIVDKDVSGLMFDVGDVAALEQHLRALVASPTRRRALGHAGRARAEEKFSSLRYATDVENMYRTLLRRKGIEPGGA